MTRFEMRLRSSTIATIGRAYREGTARPSDVIRDCLARASGSDANAVFIHLERTTSLREARRADDRFKTSTARGALDGVPIVYKDVFDMRGNVTSSGSIAIPRSAASRDAAVVATLRAAGAIAMGKANLSEFAFSGLGTNPHFGTPLNPVAGKEEPRICGGSSSGCAAAVSRALCAVAIGTDTSGSIRVPAAFCGLVGYRPTTGRYSLRGVAKLAPSLDTVGTLARSVADVRIVDRVLRGLPEQRRLPRGPHGTGSTRLVWLAAPSGTKISDEVEAICRDWLRDLRRAGSRWTSGSLPEFEKSVEAFGVHGTLVAAEAGHVLRNIWSTGSIDLVDPDIAARLRKASGMLAADAVALLELQQQLVGDLRSRVGRVVYMLPTVPAVAARISDLNSGSFAAINAQALSLTMPLSFLDMPSIALPCGLTASGMPASVQLACAPGQDDLLLETAHYLEELGLVRPSIPFAGAN